MDDLGNAGDLRGGLCGGIGALAGHEDVDVVPPQAAAAVTVLSVAGRGLQCWALSCSSAMPKCEVGAAQRAASVATFFR